jgi:hypothetical protein
MGNESGDNYLQWLFRNTMKGIAIVLGLGFLFSGGWKWGESKWIRIFQVLQLYKEKVDSSFSKEIAEKYNYQYQEAEMARKDRHKFSIYYVAIIAVFSGGYLIITGFAFNALWLFLINWAMFWIMDFLLNIFMKEKIWKLGTTANLDKIPFWVRFVLILVFICGLVFFGNAQGNTQGLKTDLVIQFNNESTSVTKTAKVETHGNYNLIVCEIPEKAQISDTLFNVFIDFNFWWVEKTFTKEEKFYLMSQWDIILKAPVNEFNKKSIAFFEMNKLIKEGIKRTLDIDGVKKRYYRLTN